MEIYGLSSIFHNSHIVNFSRLSINARPGFFLDTVLRSSLVMSAFVIMIVVS